MVDGNLCDQPGEQAAGVVRKPFVAGEGRGCGGEQRSDGLDRPQAADAVVRGLREPYDGGYRAALVAVAGRFAAPRRSVDEGFAVRGPDDRTVVVEQFRTRDMLPPQPRVGAFACSRFAEEQHGPAVQADDRRMDGYGLPRHGGDVQKAPGSHVVVMSRGEDIPDTTRQEAAELAVVYSSTFKAGAAAKVAVDTTEVKNIWKANGAKPGMVLYEVYTTVYVTPREGLEKALKTK